MCRSLSNIFCIYKKKKKRGSWVVESLERVTSVWAMIPQFMSLSLIWGSAISTETDSDSLFPPLSTYLISLSLPLSKNNE